MAKKKKTAAKKKPVTNEQILQIMNKGFGDVRKKMTNMRNGLIGEMYKLHEKAIEEMVIMRNELRAEIRTGENALSKKIDVVASDVKNLRFEVHQNHTTFIHHQTNLEKKVAALEATAA
jgi:hypothetical protein